MEYEKCYVFEPGDTRSAKRRKVEPQGLHRSWGQRRSAFQEAWEKVQQSIDVKLSSINAATASDIWTFLEERKDIDLGERIPTAIISTGPTGASQLFLQTQSALFKRDQSRRRFVSLTGGHGTNLKSVLKSITQQVVRDTETGIDEEDDLEHHVPRKRRRLLNYDLQIVYDEVKERKLQQIVVAVQDTEAWDNDLLSELLQHLACWHARIRFTLLLSIATSVDFLEQRLSKEATKCLEGQLFDVTPTGDEIENIFEAVTDREVPLWIGPGLLSMTLERQTDYIQNTNSFVEAMKYAYMTCYFANALSIFLDVRRKAAEVPADHYQAVRNLDSFRSYCRGLLESKQTLRLQDLFDDDRRLLSCILNEVSDGRRALAEMAAAVGVLRELQRCLAVQQIQPKSKLYVQAMSDKLNDSSQIRSLLLSIRKAPSDTVLKAMDANLQLSFNSDYRETFQGLREELGTLLQDQSESHQPLRSEHDIKNSTLRTTIVAQKVELSKQKSSLSKQDTEYTTILRRFSDTLEQYFKQTFIDPKRLPFHEIFLYDHKSPHREVFTPRPRHAVERALAAPHDYLDCDCCAPNEGDGDEATLSATQPATAILYQLYLETGSLINVSDLWQAFQAVMGDERSEEQNMALFQKALAELSYLGLLKGTRKRIDHVAKVAWKGL